MGILSQHKVNVNDQIKEIEDIETHISDYDWREFYRDAELLCKSNALTSVLVDYIHGKLDKNKFYNSLLLNLTGRSKDLLKLSKNVSIKGEEKYLLWHNVCNLQRIMYRLKSAINQQYIKSINNEYNGSDNVSKKDIEDIVNLSAKLNHTLVEKSFNNVRGTDLDWCDIAVIYEATLILRRNSKVAGALYLANQAMNCNIRPESYIPNKETHSSAPELIESHGLISFNPYILSVDWAKDKVDFDLAFAADNLMKISRALSLNSKAASIQGLNPSMEDYEHLCDMFKRYYQYIRKHTSKINLSAVLQIESLVRVLAHNLSWYNFDREKYIVYSRKMLSRRAIKICEMLKSSVENTSNSRYDNKLKHLIQAKIDQDTGILLANILPISLLNSEEDEGDDSEGNEDDDLFDIDSDLDSSKINYGNYLKKGWDEDFDRPVLLRNEFSRIIEKNILKRSKSIDEQLYIDTGLLFNAFNRSNLLTNGQLSEHLSRTSGKPSKHLRFFPQSEVNKCQNSLSLAYLNALTTEPDNYGLFGRIREILETTFNLEEDKNNFDGKQQEKTEPKKWRVKSKIKCRPQFTIGHLAKGKGYGKAKRASLTRINRLDPMMFIGSTLASLENLISVQLKDSKPQEVLDAAVRLCDFSVNDMIRGGYRLHFHEILNYAEEIHYSPMRISSKELHYMDTKGKLNYTTSQLLRLSFVRLYSLALKSEQLVNVLLQRPLREPFLSSCVIIIEQVRALLKFLHEDWICAYKDLVDDGFELLEVELDEGRIEYLNEFKGRLRPSLDVNTVRKDRNKELNYSDVATEYILSNSLTFEEIDKTMNKSIQRLDFEHNIGKNWNKLLKSSLMMKSELPLIINNFEEESILDSTHVHLGLDLTYVKVKPELSAAFNKLKQNKERESFLWHRLAFFPTSFDGRIIVSSTTFRDINESQEDDKKGNSSTDSAQSLLWGLVKETYQKYWS